MLRNDKLQSLHYRELTNKFDYLYAKRAYCHWYNQIDSTDFDYAREKIECRIKDWEYMGGITEDEDE